MSLTGRKKVIVPYTSITRENVSDVLKLALPIHLINVADMNYLFNYHKGIQPILRRTKQVREEINNKIVVNLAQEIVSFKVGYLLWKPIQYVARKEDVDKESLELLGDYSVNDCKDSKDKKLATDQSICGVGELFVQPNKRYELGDDNEAPYETIAVDPRMAFAIYSSQIGNKKIGGVVLDCEERDGQLVWRCQIFTDTEYFLIESSDYTIKEEGKNALGYIPLEEYPLNEDRIGDFEIVLGLMDSVSLTLSNQLDGVELFIQSLLVFKNVDIDNDSFKKLKEMGAIKVKDNTDGTKTIEANVYYLNQELNQTQVNSLVKTECQFIREIVGMPAQADGTTNDGSNNGAVVLKGGWYSAEARTSNTEMLFKKSEKETLKVILHICNVMTLGQFNLKVSDIDIKFTRRNYEDILAKAQVLVQLLQTNKVAPRLAFATCGLFPDPDQAYEESKTYVEDLRKLTPQQVVKMADDGGIENETNAE